MRDFPKKIIAKINGPKGKLTPISFLVSHATVFQLASAFGILQGQNFPLIFVAIIGIMVLLIIYFTQPKPNRWLSVSIGLQIGGAIGNLCDRLYQGWVTDFLDVGPWPIFNVADSSIVVGLILLCWLFMRASPNFTEEKTLTAQHDEDICRSDGQ